MSAIFITDIYDLLFVLIQACFYRTACSCFFSEGRSYLSTIRRTPEFLVQNLIAQFTNVPFYYGNQISTLSEQTSTPSRQRNHSCVICLNPLQLCYDRLSPSNLCRNI